MKKKRLVLNIANLPVAFCLKDSRMYERILKRYRGYVYERSGAVLELEAVFTARFHGKGLQVRMSQRGSLFQVSRRDFHCQWEQHSGTLRMRPSIYAFDALVRVLYATLMPLYNGMLMHAAGVVKNRRAYLFAGRSGAGKTTVSRLSRGKVLNDEITAVRIMGKDRVELSGTPFWGEMGSGPVYRESFKLGALFFLKKDKTDRIIPLKSIFSIPAILRCCCYFGRNPDRIKEILHMAGGIAEIVPVSKLHFTRSNEFWKKILH
ncbi:hypothetical protein ACFL5V_00140 [Fibrobacterota bacterium]